jgi:hypothetical protein
VKFLILLATAILSLAIEIERRRTKLSAIQQSTPHPYLQRFRQTNLYRFLVNRIVKTVVFVSTVGSGVVAFWGPFWPTEPKIEPHDTVNASSFVLPFKIINRSILFPQNKIPISCGVDRVYFVDVIGKLGFVANVMFSPPPISIDRESLVNYPCTASDYVRIKGDGSLEIGFEHSTRMHTATEGIFHPPLQILKMCLWISGSYDVLGFKRPFHSKMFQWPAAPGQKQWIEGPITPDLPNEAWTPHGDYPNGLLPGALQCGH